MLPAARQSNLRVWSGEQVNEKRRKENRKERGGSVEAKDDGAQHREDYLAHYIAYRDFQKCRVNPHGSAHSLRWSGMEDHGDMNVTKLAIFWRMSSFYANAVYEIGCGFIIGDTLPRLKGISLHRTSSTGAWFSQALKTKRVPV
jgi:hypothetical protein